MRSDSRNKVLSEKGIDLNLAKFTKKELMTYDSSPESVIKKFPFEFDGVVRDFKMYSELLNSYMLYQQWWNITSLFPHKIANESWVNLRLRSGGKVKGFYGLGAFESFVLGIIQDSKILKLLNTGATECYPIIVPRLITISERANVRLRGRGKPYQTRVTIDEKTYLDNINFLINYKLSADTITLAYLPKGGLGKVELPPKALRNGTPEKYFKNYSTFSEKSKEVVDLSNMVGYSNLYTGWWFVIPRGLNKNGKLTKVNELEYQSLLKHKYNRTINLKWLISCALSGMDNTQIELFVKEALYEARGKEAFVKVINELFPELEGVKTYV